MTNRQGPPQKLPPATGHGATRGNITPDFNEIGQTLQRRPAQRPSMNQAFAAGGAAKPQQIAFA